MLCSRGAVYHTRETAGTFRHFHRNCDCKVVPGFEEDPMAVLVEGQDPKKIYDRLREVEKLSGSVKGSREFAREIELRDPNWLRGGKASIESEPGERHEQREIRTAKWLEQRGISCTFRKTRENVAKRTSDVLINGIPWEFKQPQGSGKNNINNQFNEASGQSDKLVIDCSRSPFSFETVCAKAKEALARRDDFTEVIVVDSERYAHFIK